MPAPRSAGKGKGGKKKGKGGKGKDRGQSPGGAPKFCFEYAQSSTCKNGENCNFAHVSPTEAAKMGLSPPAKGGKGGKEEVNRYIIYLYTVKSEFQIHTTNFHP